MYNSGIIQKAKQLFWTHKKHWLGFWYNFIVNLQEEDDFWKYFHVIWIRKFSFDWFNFRNYDLLWCLLHFYLFAHTFSNTYLFLGIEAFVFMFDRWLLCSFLCVQFFVRQLKLYLFNFMRVRIDFVLLFLLKGRQVHIVVVFIRIKACVGYAFICTQQQQ